MSSHNIILISGKMGSGKTTLSGHISEIFSADGYRVSQMKFADIIYELHDYILKTLIENGVNHGITKDRALLQFLGTDFGRRIDKDIWAKIALRRAMEKIKYRQETGVTRSIIIIDDARFENEFNIFSDALRVRLEAPEDVRKYRAESWSDVPHPSETGLDQYAMDAKFDMYFNTAELRPEHIATLLMSKIKRGSWVERRIAPVSLDHT